MMMRCSRLQLIALNFAGRLHHQYALSRCGNRIKISIVGQFCIVYIAYRLYRPLLHQVCKMISYKRDVLERQNVSEVKMGRGSPICERVCKKIVEYFKTPFLNVILQRLCKYHHLQCITSSKASEKLEKSLYERDKSKDIYWMSVVFGPSDDTASVIGMILSLTLLNGPRNTSGNHFWWSAQCVCHLQIQTEALSCKKAAI